MARPTVTPTNVERFFPDSDVIVSKTDPKGIIVYANKIFLDIAGYTEPEVLGQPHNMIRHPEMPSCIFKMMWERIQSGREMFAYICNMAKNGDHYWVLAHVTPSFDREGRIVGFHSSRRVPDKARLKDIKPFYAELRALERQHTNPKEGMTASSARVQDMLKTRGQSYDEYIHCG